jgi:hypothetical protein
MLVDAEERISCLLLKNSVCLPYIVPDTFLEFWHAKLLQASGRVFFTMMLLQKKKFVAGHSNPF